MGQALLTRVLSLWSSLAQSRCFINIRGAGRAHVWPQLLVSTLPPWALPPPVSSQPPAHTCLPAPGDCFAWGFELRVPLSLFGIPLIGYLPLSYLGGNSRGFCLGLWAGLLCLWLQVLRN